MNLQQTQLYQRLQAFSLDDAEAKFPFSKRLARENRWSFNYTQRVIEEYKKFAFLAVVADHPVSPSDPVDQVWHLHLTYTHSYWGEFCPNILQTPFHHLPSGGGAREKSKFDDWYSKTLASYHYFFGEAPPLDIWAPADIHVSQDINFVRVNPQQHWILPKVNLPKRSLPRLSFPKVSLNSLPKFGLNQYAIVFLLFVLTVTITGCQSLALVNSANPLNFTGPLFLRFYLLLVSAAVVLAYGLRWYLRQPASAPYGKSVSLDAYETGYLVGGQQRAVDTAIVNLVQSGHLKPVPEDRRLELINPLRNKTNPLELKIENAVKIGESITQIRASAASVTDQIRDRLTDLNLLLTKDQAQSAQQYPALPLFAVLFLGISKIIVGISRHKPVGFLIILCVITAIIGLFFLVVPVNRSRYGDTVLANLKVKHRMLQNAQNNSQLALAFALFGSTVLSQYGLEDLLKVFNPPSHSGNSGGFGGGGFGGGGSSCGGGGSSCGGGDSGCGGGGSSCGGGDSGCGGGCGGCGGGD
ncbi:MAG: TIGR04222 domain-containing membrane protein [Moorea sp. SIO1F2]|uniref:TIGR04222 domain-containing membrane protein n=1 Tax=Moorena sp. SIO1F2 TaxID=2607819 RepID=UPI0013B95242|nr:TIGR04222 domain-containing membrane protein [Moorena sp. SIO1F2]NET84114.1 TIGR04222 domain-containing membrane protein [Moorena sp. SIO1F2]